MKKKSAAIAPPELMAAIFGNDVGAVRAWLDAHPEAPPTRDRLGWPLLACALTRTPPEPGLEIARMFLDRGIPVDDTTDDGTTALLASANFGNDAGVRLLLERGAVIDGALLHAAHGGLGWLVVRCLEASHDVNARSAQGTNALFEAVCGLYKPIDDSCRLAIVRRLLAHGADATVRIDLDHGTPLHWAAWGGDLALVEALLDARADPRVATGPSKRQSLHSLVDHAEKSAPVLRALVARGADINAPDASGWTPLHCAVAERREHAARALLDAGASRESRTTAPRREERLRKTLKARLTPLDLAKLVPHNDRVVALLA